MLEVDVVRLAEADPRAAIALIEPALDEGLSASDRALHHYAAGVAYRNLEDLDESNRHLRRAADLALADANLVLHGDAQVSLAATSAMAGNIDKAFELLDEAEGSPKPASTHAQTQRAGWMARMGDIDGALRAFSTAEATLADDDLRWLGHLRNNRGLLFTYMGRFDEAEKDLRQALADYTLARLAVAVAEAQHNLGFLLTRRGDLVEALELFQKASTTYQDLRLDPGELPLDEAEALLQAGLARQATDVAQTAVTQLRLKGVQTELAEAYLMYGRAAAAAGDVAAANRAASAASNTFALQGRAAWQARAELLRATIGHGSAISLRALADELAEGGLTAAAIEAQLAASVVDGADPAGLDRAKQWLRRLRPPPLPLVIAEARASMRSARIRKADGPAARAALRGVVAAERLAAGAPSPEVQAGFSTLVEELIDVGRSAALAGADNTRLFRWIEAGRSIALSPPPVMRSQHPATSAAREQVRNLRTQANEGAGTSLASALAAGERVAARVERSRPGRVRYPESCTLGSYKKRLFERQGIHLFENSGRLHGLSIDGRARRLEAFDAAWFTHELEDLALSLVQAEGTTTSSASGGKRGVRFGRLAPEATVVICPPRRLFAAPWSAIPELAHNPVVITPSARWYAAVQTPVTSEAAGIIRGPGLLTAESEHRAIVAAHGDAGPVGTTTKAARKILSNTPIVHIAAHATFRSDSPLFSTIELDDGPLFVYDVSDLESVPEIIIISACNAGSSRGGNGGLLGFVGALLGLGTATVIAPVVPVPDEPPTVELMAAVHEGLASGLEPPVALHRARQTVTHPVGHAFQCFGR